MNRIDPVSGDIVIMLLVYKGALRHCNHEVGIEYAVGVDLSVL
jgi:hypothetical protein